HQRVINAFVNVRFWLKLWNPIIRNVFNSVHSTRTFLKMIISHILNILWISNKNFIIVNFLDQTINSNGTHFTINNRIDHAFLVDCEIFFTSFNKEFHLIFIVLFHLMFEFQNQKMVEFFNVSFNMWQSSRGEVGRRKIYSIFKRNSYT